jgi:MOSC domain-containing protein
MDTRGHRRPREPLMHLEYMYRYPVKGLTAEWLDQIELTAGNPMPWDRAFALALDGVRFDPHSPHFLVKTNFLQLMNNARVALLKSDFNPETGMLSISGPGAKPILENVLTDRGRERVAAHLTAFMGRELKGSPRLLFSPGHSFSDARERAVSIINLNSIRDLEKRVGAERHLMRFRANLYVAGADPWVENHWEGRQITIGETAIRIIRPIPRCAATQVNPDTAERDSNPPRELRAAYGHLNLGAFAEVVRGGIIRQGDPVTVN